MSGDINDVFRYGEAPDYQGRLEKEVLRLREAATRQRAEMRTLSLENVETISRLSTVLARFDALNLAYRALEVLKGSDVNDALVTAGETLQTRLDRLQVENAQLRIAAGEKTTDIAVACTNLVNAFQCARTCLKHMIEVAALAGVDMDDNQTAACVTLYGKFEQDFPIDRENGFMYVPSMGASEQPTSVKVQTAPSTPTKQ